MGSQELYKSGQAAILGIGTAVPPYVLPQSSFADYYFDISNSNHQNDLKAKLAKICKPLHLLYSSFSRLRHLSPPATIDEEVQLPARGCNPAPSPIEDDKSASYHRREGEATPWLPTATTVVAPPSAAGHRADTVFAASSYSSLAATAREQPCLHRRCHRSYPQPLGTVVGRASHARHSATCAVTGLSTLAHVLSPREFTACSATCDVVLVSIPPVVTETPFTGRNEG
uniref:Chalcone/stilbene synthase N-terminal domain-containing protein n=1 Tax=Leersia perrieri TaxID=77586 RepID=A0A0D9W2K0_9ORYZ